ncbi:MAG: hypothetical protein ACRDRK_03775 [Pseudonocardia sp.]
MSAPQIAHPAPARRTPTGGTGPIRLRALLTALTLTPGPLGLPARPPSAAVPGACWFVADRTSVELASDDPITLARARGTFTPHPIAVPDARWIITVLRTASLDPAPVAFIGTSLTEIDPGVRARFHTHPTLGDTWWIASPPLIIHNNPRSRWVGIRYTDQPQPVTGHPESPPGYLPTRSDHGAETPHDRPAVRTGSARLPVRSDA